VTGVTNAPRAPRVPWMPLFRSASLLLPSALAWKLACSTLHTSQLDEAVTRLMGPLLLFTMGGLLLRMVDALLRRRPVGDAIDLLTGAGCAMAWLGAAATVAGVWVGWASLSVVGLFGLGVLYLDVLWTMLRTSGRDPWRRASLTRRFVPARVVEGESVVEEVRLSGARIPTGFRLFASGRVGPRWPTSRYVVDAARSGSDVVLESDLGRAIRGEHRTEPLEVWLQDVLGLCHSPRVRVGAARLTVLPRAVRVDGVRPLLGEGGHDLEPRTTRRLPTQGTFRLREYQPGDDVRRIHWLRSLTARQIVVRLPDELPPDQPAVRLVLDTFHPRLGSGAESLTCDGPDLLLDALVRVWLGTARALAAAGVRTSLVAAVAKGDEFAAMSRPFMPRVLGPAQELGMKVSWQNALPPAALLTQEQAVVVSHRLPADAAELVARWIVVPAPLWAAPAQPRVYALPGILPFPAGSPDNRWSRRRRDHSRRHRVQDDWVAFGVFCGHSRVYQRGHFVAHPDGQARARLEALT
jgi:uncharacterized protein (DUF58 family)